MDNPSNLSVNNVTLAGHGASLRTVNSTVTWNRRQDYVANLSESSNVSIGPSGVTLAANLTNRIPDGDFRTQGPWTYVNDSGVPYRVNATWNSSAQAALLQHTSPSTEQLWQNMDSIAGWSWYSPNATGQVYEVGGGHGGGGMLGLNISTHLATPFSASAVWNLFPPNPASNVHWNSVDRLVLWVKMNQTEPVTLNLTAAVAITGVRLTTPAQTLHMDWQQIVFNLSQLGTPTERSNLSSVALQVNGQATVPPNTWVYFDDVQVGVAKVFTSYAQVFQAFTKDASSTTAPGSAYLLFDWCVCNTSAVRSADPYYSLVGPTGSLAAGLGVPPQARWNHFSEDVSPYVTAAGSYTITFGFLIHANDTAASNATMWVDNASFVFPNRHNGTYLSVPVSLGVDSRILNLSWSATTSLSTPALLSLRTGNGSSNWGPWTSWNQTGNFVVNLPPGRYFQVAVALNTTNASNTPTLRSFSLTTWHHVLTGTITSDPVPVQGTFLRWRVLACRKVTSPATSVTFSVGNGSYWTSAPADGNLSSYPGSYMRWKATLSTVDGVQTPVLDGVNITYEFLGPVVFVVVSPGDPPTVASGDSVQFSAQALDSGHHVLPGTPIAWSTTDPIGVVDNTGRYTAGRVGVWNVTASAVGLGVFGSVQVRVLPGGFAAFWPYAVLAVVACIGFAAYEVVIRRMFAIDDVFLISKDGRLIMHNTRRMRADRDEDILSGMLTAIMAFLRDQDPEENGELKQFKVGGKTTLLERGKHAYLTAIYSGRVPGWAGKDLHRFMGDLETRFGGAFSTWSGSPEDLQGLKEYMRRFVTRVRYRGDSRFRGRET